MDRGNPVLLVSKKEAKNDKHRRYFKGEHKQHKGWKFKEPNTSNLTTIESK